jgi:hypothetical protein
MTVVAAPVPVPVAAAAAKAPVAPRFECIKTPALKTLCKLVTLVGYSQRTVEIVKACCDQLDELIDPCNESMSRMIADLRHNVRNPEPAGFVQLYPRTDQDRVTAIVGCASNLALFQALRKIMVFVKSPPSIHDGSQMYDQRHKIDEILSDCGYTFDDLIEVQRDSTRFMSARASHQFYIELLKMLRVVVIHIRALNEGIKLFQERHREI